MADLHPLFRRRGYLVSYVVANPHVCVIDGGPVQRNLASLEHAMAAIDAMPQRRIRVGTPSGHHPGCPRTPSPAVSQARRGER